MHYQPHVYVYTVSFFFLRCVQSKDSLVAHAWEEVKKGTKNSCTTFLLLHPCFHHFPLKKFLCLLVNFDLPSVNALFYAFISLFFSNFCFILTFLLRFDRLWFWQHLDKYLLSSFQTVFFKIKTIFSCNFFQIFHPCTPNVINPSWLTWVAISRSRSVWSRASIG